MRILLVHPPVDHEVPDMYRTESLGLGYIASVLRRSGHEVEVFDSHLRCVDARETLREILSREFDCLGITAANACTNSLLAIAKAVRRARESALILAGGYLPTLSPDHLLKACPDLDLIVRGEGENVVSEVLGCVDRGEEWRGTPGIGFLDDGKPVLNPLPPRIDDLDSLPFPARDALKQAKVPMSAGIASSRGCYHVCSFCCIQSFYSLSGSRAPRFRSPENVVDEIESVIGETGIREFRFVDDDFIGPGEKTRARIVRLAEEIIDRGLGITFKVEFRADEVDAEIIAVLKKAGLTDIFLGIESGVQRQLDTYNKRTTVEQNKRAIEIVRRSGVNLRCGFIMFDPYITVSEIQENMQFIRDMGLDKDAKGGFAPLVTKMILHRGVPLEHRLREDGLLLEKGIDVDYSFKDPAASMAIRFALASSTVSALAKRIGRVFRR